MVSPNDQWPVKNFGHVRYLVEFVRLCLEEDELKKITLRCVRCKMT